MLRTLVIACSVLALTSVTGAGQNTKPETIDFTVYPDYFEKNTSGLKGDGSYLVLTSKEAFEKVFGLRPPVMGAAKSLPLPDNAFDRSLVLTAIKRGTAPTTFEDITLAADGTTLTLKYKPVAGTASTATFASPLIISLQRNNYKKVVFMEKDKTVATVDVK